MLISCLIQADHDLRCEEYLLLSASKKRFRYMRNYCICARSGWGFDWRYREVSDYNSCLNRWYEHFQPDRFIVKSYEEFNTNPQKMLSDVLDHVGFSDSSTLAQTAIECNQDAPKIHPRKTTRLPALASVLWDPAVRTRAQKFMPASIRKLISSGIRNVAVSDRRPELDAQTILKAKSRLSDLPARPGTSTPTNASAPQPSP